MSLFALKQASEETRNSEQAAPMGSDAYLVSRGGEILRGNVRGRVIFYAGVSGKYTRASLAGVFSVGERGGDFSRRNVRIVSVSACRIASLTSTPVAFMIRATEPG